MLRKFESLRIFRNIHSIIGLALTFPRYFLETVIQFYTRNHTVQQFPSSKVNSISLKALKQQFSKMADSGDLVWGEDEKPWERR